MPKQENAMLTRELLLLLHQKGKITTNSALQYAYKENWSEAFAAILKGIKGGTEIEKALDIELGEGFSTNYLNSSVCLKKIEFLKVILEKIKEIKDKRKIKKIINKQNNMLLTGFQQAVFTGDFEIICLLLDTKCIDPTALEIYMGLRTSALHTAAMLQPDILKTILEKMPDININAENILGMTPIFFSVIGKNFTSTKILLEKNADLTIPSIKGDNVLHLVSTKKLSNKELATFIETINGYYEKPALAEQKEQVFSKLVQKTNKAGYSPLGLLVANKNKEQELLLQLYLKTFGAYVTRNDMLKIFLSELPFSRGEVFVKCFQEHLSHLFDENIMLVLEDYLNKPDHPYNLFFNPNMKVVHAWITLRKEYLENTSKTLEPEAKSLSQEKDPLSLLGEKKVQQATPTETEPCIPVFSTPLGTYPLPTEAEEAEKIHEPERTSGVIDTPLSASGKHLMYQKIKCATEKKLKIIEAKIIQESHAKKNREMQAISEESYKFLVKGTNDLELTLKKRKNICTYLCDTGHMHVTYHNHDGPIVCLHQRKKCVNFYLIEKTCKLDKGEEDGFIRGLLHEGGLHPVKNQDLFLVKSWSTGKRLCGTHCYTGTTPDGTIYTLYVLNEVQSHDFAYKPKSKVAGKTQTHPMVVKTLAPLERFLGDQPDDEKNEKTATSPRRIKSR